MKRARLASGWDTVGKLHFEGFKEGLAFERRGDTCDGPEKFAWARGVALAPVGAAAGGGGSGAGRSRWGLVTASQWKVGASGASRFVERWARDES